MPNSNPYLGPYANPTKDPLWGPYDSISSAEMTLNSFHGFIVAKTIGIRQSDESIVEYWVQPVDGMNRLVQKNTGGSDPNAYHKPSNGIPLTDLGQDVQTLLGKVENADVDGTGNDTKLATVGSVKALIDGQEGKRVEPITSWPQNPDETLIYLIDNREGSNPINIGTENIPAGTTAYVYHDGNGWVVLGGSSISLPSDLSVTPNFVQGKYVNGGDGTIADSTNGYVVAEAVVPVGATSVKFLGVQFSSQYSSGYAFIDKSGNLVAGGFSKYDVGSSAGAKEYDLAIPAGATMLKWTLDMSNTTMLSTYCTFANATTRNAEEEIMRATAYLPYDERARLVAPASIEPGAYISSDGTKTSRSGRDITTYNMMDMDDDVYIVVHQASSGLGTGGSAVALKKGDSIYSLFLSSTTKMRTYRLHKSGYDAILVSKSDADGSYVNLYTSKRVGRPAEAIAESSFVRGKSLTSSGAEHTDATYTIHKFDMRPWRGMRINVRLHNDGRLIGTEGLLMGLFDGSTYTKYGSLGINSITNGVREVSHDYFVPSYADTLCVVTNNKADTYIDVWAEPVSDKTPSFEQTVNYGQIKNPPFQHKDKDTDTIRVLLIGSSYGMDTVAALRDVSAVMGVKVSVGNLYHSAAKVSEWVGLIGDSAAYSTYNPTFQYVPAQGDEIPATPHSLEDVLAAKDYDVIILHNGKAESYAIGSPKVDEDMHTWLKFLKKNATNPNVVFAINNTWMARSEVNYWKGGYEVTQRLMRQTGIDVVLPCGAALRKLYNNYKETNTSRIYIDGTHLEKGMARVTASLAVFGAIITPMTGVGVRSYVYTSDTGYNTGSTLSVASLSDGYQIYDVTSENYAECVDCALEALADRWYY